MWSSTEVQVDEGCLLNGSLDNRLAQGTEECGILMFTENALFLSSKQDGNDIRRLHFFIIFFFFKRMRQTSVASYDALCVQTRPLKDPALELGHRKRLIRWPRGGGDGAPVAMTHCSHGWPHLWLKLYKIVANLYTLTWAIDLISPQCFFFLVAISDRCGSQYSKEW